LFAAKYRAGRAGTQNKQTTLPQAQKQHKETTMGEKGKADELNKKTKGGESEDKQLSLCSAVLGDWRYSSTHF
jgi:hypothetical protein